MGGGGGGRTETSFVEGGMGDCDRNSLFIFWNSTINVFQETGKMPATYSIAEMSLKIGFIFVFLGYKWAYHLAIFVSNNFHAWFSVIYLGPKPLHITVWPILTVLTFEAISLAKLATDNPKIVFLIEYTEDEHPA